MNWSEGYESSYYCTVLDPYSWRDIDRFEITGGQISRNTESLIESANIECVNYNLGEQWIRIWLNTIQDGKAEHIPLFTGLSTSPMDNAEGVLVKNTLSCYSVLKPCSDILLPRGWYAPSGSGVGVIKDLLNTPAPVTIDEDIPRLTRNIIAEAKETNLSMLHKILLAMDLRIRILGNGEIQIKKQAVDISAEFGIDNDCIEPSYTRKYDWYKCPNVFRANSGDESVTVRDDDINSPLSTVNRGREIWEEEDSCEFNTGETLYEYAVRRLKEKQLVAKKISYTRRYNPDVYVTDLVNIKYPQFDGVYLVTSQNIELGYGATTTESAVK